MTTTASIHNESKANRKRRVQQCLKQIKQFIVEHRSDPAPLNKIGTVDALHRTLELLRATVVVRQRKAELDRLHHQHQRCSPDRSSVDTWIDSPPHHSHHHQHQAQLADDVWSLTNDLNERLLVTVKVSLPDGAIVDVRKVTSETNDLEVSSSRFLVKYRKISI